MLADLIAEAMTALGLTETELAHEVGINQKSVSRWLHGTIPRAGTLRKLCEVLHLDPAVAAQAAYGGEGTAPEPTPAAEIRDWETVLRRLRLAERDLRDLRLAATRLLERERQAG